MGAVAYVSADGTLRVVEGDDGRPVVELADGADAIRQIRWIGAVVRPDRFSNGASYLRGWPEICCALGVQDEETARGYARRKENRLPVRWDAQGRPFISELLLGAWVTDQTVPVGRSQRAS